MMWTSSLIILEAEQYVYNGDDFNINLNYHKENSHVMPALIRRFHEAKINNEDEISIWGTGNPRREFLHVDDLASACVFAFENIDAHEIYKQKYGHSTPDAPVEIINLRLVAVGIIERSIDYSKSDDDGKQKIKSKYNREVIFNNKKFNTSIIDRNSIKIEDSFNEPLIVEEESATTVVPPGYLMSRDLMGNLIIKRNEK